MSLSWFSVHGAVKRRLSNWLPVQFQLTPSAQMELKKERKKERSVWVGEHNSDSVCLLIYLSFLGNWQCGVWTVECRLCGSHLSLQLRRSDSVCILHCFAAWVQMEISPFWVCGSRRNKKKTNCVHSTQKKNTYWSWLLNEVTAEWLLNEVTADGLLNQSTVTANHN